MAVIRLGGFSGENRAIEPKLLPESVGTISRNQKPGRGDLRPWKTPTSVATVPAGTNTIYRMGRDVASDSNYWLSWTGVVHAARGFDVADTTERTYYTGDGAPKVTDNTVALASTPYPTASRPLGIPAPTTGLVVGATGGTDAATTETYYYTYTFVNDWGWESAPAPVSNAISRKTDATGTITGFDAAPSGNYNINRIRIYRTQSGATGATEFYFLSEVAYGTTSTTDTNPALGEILPSTTWLPAPGVPQGGSANATETNLTFLTPMWNGMMAGLCGNQVRICETNLPYAWPRSYDAVPPDGKAVGLGVYGQSLLVLTTNRPILLSGSSPDAMDQQPLDLPQGCVSSRSVVSMGSGVAWASEDGLCWYGSGGARILTAGVMLREDWQALVPSSIIGRMYEGLYFGSYDDGTGRKGFFLDTSGNNGIYFLDTGYSAMYFDELRDQLYVLDGTSVKKWDAGTAMTVRFRSKVFRTPRPINFGAAEVTASAYPFTFKLYGDGELRHTQTVTAQSPFRLPSGFLAQQWQIELEGTNAIQAAAIASSIAELANV